MSYVIRYYTETNIIDEILPDIETVKQRGKELTKARINYNVFTGGL